MGFAHFLTNTDAIARAVLALMLLASVTWYLIIVKGGRIIRMRRRSEAFLDAFWAAPNLDRMTRFSIPVAKASVMQKSHCVTSSTSQWMAGRTTSATCG